MNRVHTMAFRLLVGSLLFCSSLATRTPAQTPSSSPSPSPQSAKPAETKPANQEGEKNPFAPEPAAPLTSDDWPVPMTRAPLARNYTS